MFNFYYLKIKNKIQIQIIIIILKQIINKPLDLNRGDNKPNFLKTFFSSFVSSLFRPLKNPELFFFFFLMIFFYF
jgi:hypothetical protein